MSAHLSVPDSGHSLYGPPQHRRQRYGSYGGFSGLLGRYERGFENVNRDELYKNRSSREIDTIFKRIRLPTDLFSY